MNLFNELSEQIKDCGRAHSINMLSHAAKTGTEEQKLNQVMLVMYTGVNALAQHVLNLEQQDGMSRGQALLSIREAIEDEVNYLDDGTEPEFIGFSNDS